MFILTIFFLGSIILIHCVCNHGQIYYTIRFYMDYRKFYKFQNIYQGSMINLLGLAIYFTLTLIGTPSCNQMQKINGLYFVSSSNVRTGILDVQ